MRKLFAYTIFRYHPHYVMVALHAICHFAKCIPTGISARLKGGERCQRIRTLPKRMFIIRRRVEMPFINEIISFAFDKKAAFWLYNPTMRPVFDFTTNLVYKQINSWILIFVLLSLKWPNKVILMRESKRLCNCVFSIIMSYWHRKAQCYAYINMTSI